MMHSKPIEDCAMCRGPVDGAHLGADGDPLCNSCAAARMEGERDAMLERLQRVRVLAESWVRGSDELTRRFGTDVFRALDEWGDGRGS